MAFFNGMVQNTVSIVPANNGMAIKVDGTLFSVFYADSCLHDLHIFTYGWCPNKYIRIPMIWHPLKYSQKIAGGVKWRRYGGEFVSKSCQGPKGTYKNHNQPVMHLYCPKLTNAWLIMLVASLYYLHHIVHHVSKVHKNGQE